MRKICSTWRRTGAALLVAMTVSVALLAPRGDIGGLVSRARAQSTPPNDAFANPAFVGPGISPPGAADLLPWDGAQPTTGATLEAGETAPCGPIGATVWYALNADTVGNVEVTTAGSDFDTILAVYTAGGGFLPSPPGANLSSVACNDDAAGVTSSLSFTMSRGTQYYIQVGGKQGATGNLKLHVACNPECAPSNDDFFAPGQLFVDAYTNTQTVRSTTTAATTQPGEQSPCGNIGKTVWYQTQVEQDATVVFDTAGSDFDTVIALYAYPPPPDGSFDPRPERLQPVACSASAGGRARLSARLTSGQPYWIQAGGERAATGTLTLTVSCDPGCPPYIDSFVNAPSFFGGVSMEISTVGATLEPGEPQACGATSHTVWFSFFMPGDTTIVADTGGSDYPTVLALYDISSPTYPLTLDQLARVACAESDGGAADSGTAHITFSARARHTYFLQVGGRNDASGALHISIECEAVCPPGNDSSSGSYSATVPYGFPYGDVEDTRGATVEDGEPLDCGNMGKTVWYLIDSPSDVSMSFDTDTSDFDTAIAVYQADFPLSPPGGAAHRVACATSDATGRAHVEFPLKAGQGLFVQVGGMDGAGGTLQFHGDCAAGCPPGNDNLNQAYDIAYSGFVDSPNIRGATLEPGEPQGCGEVDATVWYRVTLVGAGSLTVDLTGSEGSPSVAVYQAQGFSPPPGVLAQADCSTGAARHDFAITEAGVYYVQIGGKSGEPGQLQVRIDCGAVCSQSIESPETGPGAAGGGGSINLPNTGSGGYLPGARRHAH